MATSCETSPIVSAREPGVMLTEVMVGVGGLTVTMAGALLTFSQAAVMEAVPLAIAVTVPPLDTDEIRG